MKIAIVGGGISGMVTAYRLHRNHDVTLLEANSYVGGHTNTVDVNVGGVTFPVDTGFIVFNERTYPNFISLMNELEVDSQPTRMSFSVSCEQTGLEYSGASLNGLFAQRRNLFSPKFYRMLKDLVRFNRMGRELLATEDESLSVNDFLSEFGYSETFIQRYFLPMGAAIWSAPFDTFGRFPIRFIAEFYRNHGLLDIVNRPRWHVIKGGSRSYIPKLTEGWKDRIHLNSPVKSVQRLDGRVLLQTVSGVESEFDHVVFACHSDQALKILGQDATSTETEILSAFPYESNVATLHTQESMLPKLRRAWACWNYAIPKTESVHATLTYNMNLLQSIESDKTFCVTLNDDGRIRDENILGQYQYSHPIFGLDRLKMQKRHSDLINQNNTSFCGAYWGNGFHEDGVNSGIAVSNALLDAAKTSNLNGTGMHESPGLKAPAR